MANKDLFKQAIAEAKSVREAAIANAKNALEETLTPHLKDLLAAKLQEMEDSQEEVVKEDTVEEVEETLAEDLAGLEAVAEAEEDEAEDDSVESEDEAEEAGEEAGEEEEVEDDQELGDLSVEDFKALIRDIISQEMGVAGEPDGDELGADMDAGDIEGAGEEPGLEPEEGEEEIDLDELLRELESVSEEKEEEMEEAIEEEVAEEVENTELAEALETIETLKAQLSEVNLLNAKLLYVNKVFKANNLTESQKVNIIAAFDKAETVKEVKLVFETVSENVVATKKETVTESKLKGMASKATGTTASKPEVISEVSDAVKRMQKLAGII